MTKEGLSRERRHPHPDELAALVDARAAERGITRGEYINRALASPALVRPDMARALDNLVRHYDALSAAAPVDRLERFLRERSGREGPRTFTPTTSPTTRSASCTPATSWEGRATRVTVRRREATGKYIVEAPRARRGRRGPTSLVGIDSWVATDP
jgi:hypothetical protein